jgi:hypothetical protein
MKITHTNVIKVELTLDEVRDALRAYNTDMMIELADVFFGIDRSDFNRRQLPVPKFHIRQMAAFAEVMADENRRAELVEKAGVNLIETPSRNQDWRDLIENNPYLFLDPDILTNAGGPFGELQVTLDGVALDVETLLNNV